MAEDMTTETRKDLFPNLAVYVLAVIFVAVGILNSTPLIPGWDDMWREIGRAHV